MVRVATSGCGGTRDIVIASEGRPTVFAQRGRTSGLRRSDRGIRAGAPAAVAAALVLFAARASATEVESPPPPAPIHPSVELASPPPAAMPAPLLSGEPG